MSEVASDLTSLIRLLAIATQNAETEQSLSRSNLVIGYECKNDTYVLLSDEGLDKVCFMLLRLSQLTKWIVLPCRG